MTAEPLDWFAKKYKQRLGNRFATFHNALSLLLARTDGTRTIVETGCVREKNDFSAGYSTVLFAEFLARYGGRLDTVDISAHNIAICKKLVRRYEPQVSCHVSDSIAFLRDWPNIGNGRPIDLLYLDSLDYPVYLERPREPSWEQCLGEFEAALPYLAPNAIVLIDDSDLPGGGKGLYARERLQELGWRCELDAYQSLWSRP